MPALVAVSADETGKAKQTALAYAACDRRDPRRCARHHVRGGDRDRPLRRAGRALRRSRRAHQGQLRDAGERGLPAGVRLLRDAARGEAHRRPHLRGRHHQHALLDLRHRGVRRHDAWPADRHRRRPAPRCARSSTRSRPASSPRSGSSRTRPGGRCSTRCASKSAEHPIEEVGDRLRSMMPWIGAGQGEAAGRLRGLALGVLGAAADHRAAVLAASRLRSLRSLRTAAARGNPMLDGLRFRSAVRRVVVGSRCV